MLHNLGNFSIPLQKTFRKWRFTKNSDCWNLLCQFFFMKIYRQKHSSGHKWAKVEFEQPKMGLVPLSTMLPPDPPISQTFQTRWFWQDWYVQMCKCSGSAFFWQIQTVYQELFFPFWFNLTNNPGKVNVVKFFFWISSLTKAFSEYVYLCVLYCIAFGSVKFSAKKRIASDHLPC